MLFFNLIQFHSSSSGKNKNTTKAKKKRHENKNKKKNEIVLPIHLPFGSHASDNRHNIISQNNTLYTHKH